MVFNGEPSINISLPYKCTGSHCDLDMWSFDLKM